MQQLGFANVSSIVVVGMVALGCSSSEPEVGAPSSPGEPDAPAAMNEPAAPGQVPSEAEPTEMVPADRAPEGQSANVGLTPPPMANPMPPVAEAPPPGANDPPAAGAAVPSAGCGSPLAVASGRTTIGVAGATREYLLDLPEDYDRQRRDGA